MASSGYESFLLSHISTISSIESSLRSLSWILPGRFKDAELASESLSATVNVFSMFNDNLLDKAVHADPNYRPLIPPSLHSRFTRAWSDNDYGYKWAARMLELLRFTQLLIEMGLRRKASAKSRWRVIVLIEVLKAFLNFTILRITKQPVLFPPLAERDIDPTALPTPSSHTSTPTIVVSPLSSPAATPKHLDNNHEALPPNSLFTSPPRSVVEDFLLPKALTSSSVQPPLGLIKTLSTPQDWIAEGLYILRPLIYTLLIVVNRNSKSNPKRPLMAVLALELISRHLRRQPAPSAALERSEYARRDRDILWYLFRGTIWTDLTRPKLESVADRTAKTPLLGLFSALVKDWIPLIDEYYYYTSL